MDHRVLDCVEGACRPLRAAGVDTVILGCTHYPLIRPVLQRELGRGSRSSAPARRSPRRCTRPARASSGSPTTARGAATTASSPPATRRSSGGSGTRFLQLPIGAVEHVDLERRADGAGGGVSETGPATTGARAGRPARGDASARLHAQRHRLGADRGGRHARDLHRERRGVRAALDGGPGPRLDHRRVRDAPRVDGRAEARDVSRGRPDGRTVEIQRLIGRSLRGVIDFEAPRRAHGLDRLRRARGRRRHALRRDHRRLRGARAGAPPARGGGRARRGPAERVGGGRVVRRRRRRARCSTSTTPRTRAPRWTRTWS